METWYNKSIEEVSKDQKTNIDQGLTVEEAKKRLDETGPNRLKESKGRSPWQMFIDQFKDALVIILLFSAIISAAVGEISDSLVIAVILILNSTLGVIQEYKAEKSLAALKELASPRALVLRDGKQQKVEASQLVPGDIVLLDAGDYVPADLRLISVTDLKIEESVLTGESVPVEKTDKIIKDEKPPLGDQKNMAFMGTIVTYGRGRGIVTGTGMDTEMGKIAEALKDDKREPTPLQKRLDRMGKKLGLAVIGIAAIIILMGWLRGIDLLEMFMTGISLAVAAVPEGLPAVVTIVLALGVQRMIKRHAIIRRLPAVETLGATTIICTDKTGTLTKNEMTVKSIFLPGRNIKVSGEGYKPEGKFIEGNTEVKTNSDKDLALLLKAASLCNNAELTRNKDNNRDIIGDPTEGSLVVAAEKAGFTKERLNNDYERIKEFPFDSERKRMSTVHRTPDKKVIAFVKGAPDQILKRCIGYQINGKVKDLDDNVREEIVKQNKEYASQALRVLAVAYKPLDGENNLHIDNVEKGLIFLGLMGMIDPPRREVADSVKLCKQAGIRPVMITGDYSLTARAIAEELGIYKNGDKIITGSELEDMNPEELKEAVSLTTVYARVSPHHKSKIVQALKDSNEVVAMTGDGVNDAPALKKADIGVAMGITGTDVAKEAADMVLTDDNFASIVSAVEEGRGIYSNIKKFIHFLLSCNVGEIITLFLAIIVGLPRPLIPIQILWVNLVTDGFPALALGVDPAAPDLMEKPPRDPDEGVFAGKMGVNIISQGLFIGLLTLVIFFLGLHYFSLPVGQTMAFATLSFSQLIQALNARSREYSLFRLGILTNKYLILAIMISGLLQLGVMFIPFLQAAFKVIPLTGTQWLIVLLASLTPLPYVEILKALGITREE
ncbi:calcium-transporting P-type ATPase, PMR1-type [Halothermothrix orenii]|uniref:P-type Ca(2+) transporter n=1 Tax=Halothermothrix orenii (strain H 168 / OCM 544 / DSM 9562) TaxID=373903 RepID=B8D0K5_HALOH|nr:calcium-transporting P-type ATPase, PMR1-type [Halothermothrix orenii]ACL70941.1 cation-transporting ATPase A, P type (ATPase, E1-E2 type) [Halothermothrix orenii H 168]